MTHPLSILRFKESKSYDFLRKKLRTIPIKATNYRY